LPFLAVGLAIYLALPTVRRTQRRRKRRAWARSQGFREEVAVEYTEFRDAASDLNVGDPFDTPLEYLAKVAPDDEHAELAWLVTRVTYGDLGERLTETEVNAATDMATSLRKRMFRAQPLQSRVLGVLSRASLREPFTLEVPSVKLLTLRRRKKSGGAKKRPGLIAPPTRRVRFVRAVRSAVSVGRNS
jgi:hypothetical protein